MRVYPFPSPKPRPSPQPNPLGLPYPKYKYTDPPLYQSPLESFGKEMDKLEKNEKESKRLTGQEGQRVTRIDQRRLCYGIHLLIEGAGS